MRMRRGFTDFSANKLVDLTLKPSTTPAPAESLMKWRRVGFMFGVTVLSFRAICQSGSDRGISCYHLANNERYLDSAPHDKGKDECDYATRCGPIDRCGGSQFAASNWCVTCSSGQRIIKQVEARDSFIG